MWESEFLAIWKLESFTQMWEEKDVATKARRHEYEVWIDNKKLLVFAPLQLLKCTAFGATCSALFSQKREGTNVARIEADKLLVLAALRLCETEKVTRLAIFFAKTQRRKVEVLEWHFLL